MTNVLRARMEQHQQVQIELHCKGCILYSISILHLTFIHSHLNTFAIDKL